MEIDTGVLVEIIGCNNRRMQHHIGHVGHVLRPELYRDDHWHVEGAGKNILGANCCWHKSHLKPISDHRKCTWQDLNDSGIDWNPMRQTECL